MLSARAFLRLDRAPEALRVLRDTAGMPLGTEEAVTLRMLQGAALIRAGDIATGLQTLHAVQRDAAGVHPTIRSEIALNIALAQFGRRELDEAERSLDIVDAGSDIVYARALEYRGWVAWSRGNAEVAMEAFLSALTKLDGCRHYDRFLEANCIRALAHLSLERLDPKTWRIVEERRARMDWSAGGLAHPRFWIAYCAAAFAAEVEYRPRCAMREARMAEKIAPTAVIRVEALCKRASIARYAGEPLSQRDHAEAAWELFREVLPNGLSGDEILVPLVVAEELLFIDQLASAGTALQTYLDQSRTSAVLYTTHTPARFAYQRLVEGSYLEQAGQGRNAIARYREAFDIFSRTGYMRRAVATALRLAQLTGDRSFQQYATRATAHLTPQAWLRRQVDAAKAGRIRLTAVQRETIVLICQGKSNPEIARVRKRSLHTIRNLVARLFEIFGVTSREQLAVECVRRGLYTPN